MNNTDTKRDGKKRLVGLCIVYKNRNYGSDPAYQKYVKSVPIMIPFIPLYSVEKYKFLVL